MDANQEIDRTIRDTLEKLSGRKDGTFTQFEMKNDAELEKPPTKLEVTFTFSLTPSV